MPSRPPKLALGSLSVVPPTAARTSYAAPSNADDHQPATLPNAVSQQLASQLFGGFGEQLPTGVWFT